MAQYIDKAAVVAEFVAERNIQCHALYYDEQGIFHPERRLGCMCCPLTSRNKRIEEFRKHPNMVKLYIRGGGAILYTSVASIEMLACMGQMQRHRKQVSICRL
jgi:3'-phosphoadenosine 5'-phosphosulfate sulfotransferase (PAPS reductase)/FAD synthetase